MRHLTSGRLALLVSLLALAVALGGTAYAAVKITTKDIASNAVTSPKVKKDTLTGKDVDEAKLAKVPSAASADTATSAASAAKVNGVTPSKVSYRSTSATPAVLFNSNGLAISASCFSGGTNDLTLEASTTKNNSSIFVSRTDVEADTLVGADLEDGSFDPGGTFNLLPDTNTDQEDPALVDFVFENGDGTVVSGMLAVETADNGPCFVNGFVTAG